MAHVFVLIGSECLLSCACDEAFNSAQGSVWARGHCTISPPRFLADCHKRRLNQGSFVLLCFALFAFSGLCIVSVLSVLICLLSCIFHQQLHEVVSAGFRVGICCL